MKTLLLFFFLSAVEVFGLSTNQLDYLIGNGGGLTNLPDAALSANVALLNANQTFTGVNTFSNNVKIDAAHQLSVSNAAANSILITDGLQRVTNAVQGTVTLVNGVAGVSDPLALATMNLGVLNLTNSITNLVTSGYRDTNYSTGKTVILTNGTGAFDGGITIWGNNLLTMQNAAGPAGNDGTKMLLQPGGGMYFYKSFTPFLGIGTAQVSPIWGFNPYIEVKDGSGIGWTATAGGGNASTAFIKATTGTITMSNNVIATGTITTTNGYASYRSNQLAVVTISVGASPFSYTNTSGINGFVIVDGATAFSATWLNTTVQSSLAGGVTLPLQNGEWTTVTYTVAPGMFFKPQ